MMEKMRQYGAMVDMVSTNGYTLLHQAALSGNWDSIEWLLENGLRWDQQANNGIRPLDVLRQHHPQLALKVEGAASNVRLFARKT